MDLALDCHWNYNPGDIITLAQELEPFRLMWLEDPTPPDNAEALKRVTDRSPVPIFCGENHYTRHGLRQVITTQAVDVVQLIPKDLADEVLLRVEAIFEKENAEREALAAGMPIDEVYRLYGAL